jgi:hypothetical protein
MRIIEVTNEALAHAFIVVYADLYKHDPNFIRPLDKDIDEVFDVKKNKAFRFGEVCRWLLQDDNGTFIGRIAAFTHKKYKNKGDKLPTGGFGFFDVIDKQEAANLLLNTAKEWLLAKGMEAMDGPINFGERDKWWGLLVEGFDPPLYGMNYNAPYYKTLLENYGCQLFYYQNCYSRPLKGRLPEKFYTAHEKISHFGTFRAVRADKKELDKYARDFCTVYNAAWAQHEGNKAMAPEQAIILFKTMKPVMDTDLVWFVYKGEEPVACYISLPDLNQVFRYLHGKFNWWAKLKFVFLRWRGVIKNATGIVFGIVPECQSTGVDYFMIVEAAKILQASDKYAMTELQWMGDFNPKINNIAKNLDFKLSRRLATYRYQFDRDLPFTRHPIF